MDDSRPSPKYRKPSPARPSHVSTSGHNASNSESRRAPRREREKRRDKPSRNGAPSFAGPSNATSRSERKPASKIDWSEPNGGASVPSVEWEEKGFGHADFIAFQVDEGDTERKGKEREEHVREWDRGKEKMREREDAGAGRKRKAEEAEERYARRERYAAPSRKAPWTVDVNWDSCTNVAEMLNRDVEAFVKYISPTPVEDEIRSLVVAFITRAVTQAFPDAEVLPFGSYETKLYLPIGDIDLVINSPSMAYSHKEVVLQALAKTVQRAGLTDRVKIIAKAKVPIIKFVTTHGRFSVDISINQTNGVAAGKMIKQFLAEMPALRALVLVIKSFLSQRSMNEVFTGGLGSYSIVCLAISFLQMHPKIRRGEIDPMKNLGVLVMEFFELYGFYFNYHQVGISVRDGGTYFNKQDRGWLDYGSPRLLSIEDPGDISNDISRGTYGIAKVRTTFAGAHGILTAAAYLQAGIISARRGGHYASFREHDRPEDRSILSSVLGVTQETINHRRLVEEVYDQGLLHRMLGVAPKAGVKHAPPSPEQNGKARVAREKSVKSAWEEADMELGSDDERDAQPSEDESRYDIDSRAQPPKKRRRLGRSKDMHTVYTEDDEDEDGEIALHGVDDGLSDEEAEYDLSALDGDDDGPESKVESVGRKRANLGAARRAYWASKGVGAVSDSDEG